MDQLPQELISNICSYLSPDNLAAASHVSTHLQSAASDNAAKHKRIYIDYPKDKNKQLKELCSFRHRYMDTIEFYVPPPPAPKARSGKDGYSRISRAQQQHARDEFFTAQIREFFVTLKAVEGGAGEASERNRGSYSIAIFGIREPVQGGCIHLDHATRRTGLLSPTTLPSPPSARVLSIHDIGLRLKFDYHILLDLLTHLPNATQLSCHTATDDWTRFFDEEPASDFRWEYHGPRRNSRHEFRKAMGWFEKLESVELNFIFEGSGLERIHQLKPQPDLIFPAARDPFSTCIRILSMPLKNLDAPPGRRQLVLAARWDHPIVAESRNAADRVSHGCAVWGLVFRWPAR